VECKSVEVNKNGQRGNMLIGAKEKT